MYGNNEFDIKPLNSAGLHKVRLSVSMQQWLGLYVEPKADDRSTWEDENKVFDIDPIGLERLMDKAAIRADKLRRGAEQCITLEELGATFTEASTIFSRRNSVRLGNERLDIHPVYEYSPEPYSAEEDLAFMYYWAGCFFAFVHECRMALELSRRLREEASNNE